MKKRIKMIYDGDGTTSAQEVATCASTPIVFSLSPWIMQYSELTLSGQFHFWHRRANQVFFQRYWPTRQNTILLILKDNHGEWETQLMVHWSSNHSRHVLVSNNWYDNYLAKDADQQPVARKPKLSVYGSTLKCSNFLDSNMEHYQVPLG